MPKNLCQKVQQFCYSFTGSLSTMRLRSFHDLLLYPEKEKTSSGGRTDCHWSGRSTPRFAGSRSAGRV